MAYIYALMWGELVLYVGHTVQTLRQRANRHRCKKDNRCYSRFIPDDIDWDIVLLEECTTEMALMREQYYYDSLKPLYNKCRPYNGLTQNERVKEYQQTDAYRQKIKTEEYKRYNREAQRKFKEKKKAAERQD